MEQVINIFWKTYYFLTVFTFISLIVLDPFIDKVNVLPTDYNIFSIFYLIISLLTIIGIRGFVYKKRYFTKSLWILIFFILLIDYINTLMINYSLNISIYNIPFLGLALLYLYPISKYAFKMNYLWEAINIDKK